MAEDVGFPSGDGGVVEGLFEFEDLLFVLEPLHFELLLLHEDLLLIQIHLLELLPQVQNRRLRAFQLSLVFFKEIRILVCLLLHAE